MTIPGLLRNCVRNHHTVRSNQQVNHRNIKDKKDENEVKKVHSIEIIGIDHFKLLKNKIYLVSTFNVGLKQRTILDHEAKWKRLPLPRITRIKSYEWWCHLVNNWRTNTSNSIFETIVYFLDKLHSFMRQKCSTSHFLKTL